jgi:hypothetical protein
LKYVEQQVSSELSLPISLRLQNAIFTDKIVVYCVFPAMSKRPRQLPSRTIRVETRVVLIVFDGVLLHVRVYTATVAQHESGSRKALLGQ